MCLPRRLGCSRDCRRPALQPRGSTSCAHGQEQCDQELGGDARPWCSEVFRDIVVSWAVTSVKIRNFREGCPAVGNACSSMPRHRGHGGLVAVLLSTPHNVLGCRCRLRQYLQPCTQFTGEPLKCNELEFGGGAGLAGSCEPIVNVSVQLHAQDHRAGNAVWPLWGYLCSRGYATHQGQRRFGLFLFLTPPQLGVQCLLGQFWEWGASGGFTWLDQRQP